MIKTLMILFLIFSIIYILYLNGIIPITVKSSVMFIGGLSGKKAKFTSCNGYMKRRVKLKGESKYRFSLQSMLTAGSMTVELIDRDKQSVIQLNDSDCQKDIFVNWTESYTLILRFHSASGEYLLDWKEISW